jgi:hypothetical protein
MREQANHMYRTSAYFFGKIISDSPMQILIPIIYGNINNR